MGIHDLSRGGRKAIGAACGTLGLLLIALGANSMLSSANALGSDGLGTVSFGLIWAFGGALIFLPQGNSRRRDWFGTILVTCFALAFDWVAFAPGERTFTGGVSHGGVGGAFHPSETTGRVIFGAAAVVLNVASICLWVRLFKKVAKA